jgi:hypothetical protein
MSTPYNDQWVLPRGEEGRGTGCARAEQDEGADAAVNADARSARQRHRTRAARMAGGLCKRPRWIDRDT